MQVLIPTNHKRFAMTLTLETKSAANIAISFKDTERRNTYYANRVAKVNGKRELEFRFPRSPQTMMFTIYNTAIGNAPYGADKTYKISNIEFKELKDCEAWESPEQRSFIQFAQWFAENASILSAGREKPHRYQSNDGKWTIEYFDTILHNKKPIGTPARVSHTTGIIQVSKRAFWKMSIPMRLIILLHEFAHNEINPEIERDVTNESGADFGALYLYLANGYSPFEAHVAYLKVFAKANNPANTKRYQMISYYIDNFEKGKYLKCA